MNTQVGKSIGIALLLASAALFAALFAMGAFAPAGAGAQVQGGSDAPVIELSSNKPGAANVTLTVTFQTDFDVSRRGNTGNEVLVTLPKSLKKESDFDADDDITLTQNGDDVGTTTYATVAGAGDTIKISPGPAGGKNLANSVIATLTVSNLAIADAPDADEFLEIEQGEEDPGEVPDRNKHSITFHPSVLRSPAPSVSINKVDAEATAVTMSFAFTVDSNIGADAAGGHVVISLDSYGNIPDAAKGEVTGGEVDEKMPNDTSFTVKGVNNGLNLESTSTSRRVGVEVSGMENPDDTVKFTATFQQGSQPEKGAPTASAYVTKAEDVAVSELALSDVDAEAKGVTMTFKYSPVIGTNEEPTMVTLSDEFGGSASLTATQAQGADDKAVTVGPFKADKNNVITIPKAEGDAAKNILNNDRDVTVTITGLVNPSIDGPLRNAVTVKQGGFEPGLSDIYETKEGVTSYVSSPIRIRAVPKATISSAGAGADVRVDIHARAGQAVRGGSDIDVTLPGFGIPSSLDTDDILIYSDDYDGAPTSVQVSGSKVSITVPVRTEKANNAVEPARTGNRTTRITGDYEIRFKSSAGLTNPTSTGTKEIKVEDSDAADHELEVTIVSTISVKPGFVIRGDTATVTVKGVEDGTVSIHLGELNGPSLGDSEASDGVATVEIDTTGVADLIARATKDGDIDVAANTIYVKNASNNQVGDPQKLGIKPKVTLGSNAAKRAGTLEISVSDWYYGSNIVSVTIGGVEVEETEGNDSIRVSGTSETFDVTVPPTVRLGEQEVKVTGDANLNNKSATDKVTISAIALTVGPAEVVPGQQVTITGSGFTRNTDVDSITLGGMPAALPDDARSTSGGSVAVTVVVPLNVGAGQKGVTLTVGSRTGEGAIMVAQPTISISPEESLVGSIISVTGSGFASSGRVEVEYAGSVESVGETDSNGNFNVRFQVPSDAGIGSSNTVEVKTRGPNAEGIKASATHRTPGPRITVTQEAPVGGIIIITGTSFKSFSVLESVEIGDQNAKPSPAPETDQNGNFQFEARVPRLGVGSHTVTVEDGDQNTATETFTVIDTPVVSTPAEVFQPLAEMLTVVWRYDNATGSWASYSPTGPAELNDLTAVTSGVIVWIQLTERAEFQGQTLNAGWQLITLE